jgi:hypothetical protein
MSYLRYMCLFGSSLPLVVCRKAHVLFTLHVLFGLSLPLVVCRKAHVTEYGTALTNILPILFLYLNTVTVTTGTFEP